MSAATGAAGAPAPAGASSFNWVTQLRQHYLAGKHCDVSIKISLPAQPTPAKRARSGRRKKKNDGEDRSQEKNDEEVITIPCHANILCSRSPYFDACLSGDYVEGQKKEVQISLEDTEAVGDFKLLLKQCYGASYLVDEETGQRFDNVTCLRLLHLANAFEFHDCLRECLVSLGEGLVFEEAFSILDEVPEELEVYVEMKKLKLKVIDVLAAGAQQLAETIKGEVEREDLQESWEEYDYPDEEDNDDSYGDEERAQDRLAKQRKEERQRVGTALAKLLGPVHGLFDEGPNNFVMLDDKSELYHQPPLKPYAKALPEGAMEAVLASDGLVCQTENEVYTLLCFWVTQSRLDSPWEAKSRVFARLAHHIRYHHLSSYFLGEFVSRCNFANESGLLSSIMRRVQFYRDNGNAAEKDRARGIQEYTFRTKMLLTDVQTGSVSCRYVGVAFGFPVSFSLFRFSSGGTKFLCPATKFELPCVLPYVLQGKGFKGGELFMERKSISQVSVCLGPHSTPTEDFYSFTHWSGRSALDDMSWEEAISEGSPFFTNGEMAVTIVLKAKPGTT